MSGSRMIGAVLLAAGGGLLVWGYQLYGAVGNQLSRALGGGTSNDAYMAFGAGGVCLLLGVFMLARK